MQRYFWLATDLPIPHLTKNESTIVVFPSKLLNLVANLNSNFHRFTAFVLVCATFLLGANSALGARRGASNHAAQSPDRSTGSFESLRFLIGRWVKNTGAGDVEEEWAHIHFGQIEGLHREWQGQRLVSQSRIRCLSQRIRRSALYHRRLSKLDPRRQPKLAALHRADRIRWRFDSAGMPIPILRTICKQAVSCS